MQNAIIDNDAAVPELTASEPQSGSDQIAARRAHNQAQLARIEALLVELEQAFVSLETAGRNEAELERDFESAKSEEAVLLKDLERGGSPLGHLTCRQRRARLAPHRRPGTNRRAN
jgi:hypothetical protein